MGKQPTELLLSILVAVAVGFALEKLLLLDDFSWLCFSTLAIIISIAFIYLILETEKPSFISISRILVIIFVIFFPFTLAKVTQNYPSTMLVWTSNKELFYGILTGITFLLWGWAEYKERHKGKGIGIIVFGSAIIFFSVLFFVLINGGWIKV
jgi:hypothetical protein